MSEPEDPGQGMGRAMLWGALALVAVTLLVYLPAGSNGFVDFDDGAYVTQNPMVQAGLSAEGLSWAFTETHSSNWHPLTWLSHMLDCQLFGLDPRGHHWMGIGLHALAAALCLLALTVLSQRFWPSLVVASLFALHPQRVESVAWVSERKDVLSGVFFFGCLWAYGVYARRGGKLAYGLLLFSLALGLLAKQMLVTLPCLLLVLDGWPLGRFKSAGLKRCLLEKLPLFGLVLAAGLMTVHAQSEGGALSSLDALPLNARLANAAWAGAAYIGQMFWPADLAFFYPHPYIVLGDAYTPWTTRELGGALMLLVVSVLGFLLRRRLPWLLSGWLWYLGLLAPVVGIVHVGAQSMADRYAYLPTIGLYIALVWSASALAKGALQARALVGLGLGLALALVPVTRAQISVWRDSPSLFEHAIETTERNYIAHSNYGYYLQTRGRAEEAEVHYLKAIEYSPRLVDAHSNLGAIYIDRGWYDRARTKLNQALKLKPNFQKGLMLLGLLEESAGQPEAALVAYSRAARADPGYALALSAQARLTRGLGRAQEALQLLSAAQGRGVRSPELCIELAATQRELGQASQAKGTLLAGLRRFPSSTELRAEAAWFLASAREASLRDPAQATRLLAGLEGSQDWKILRARAAAQAAVGDFASARRLILEAQVAAPEGERESLKLTYSLYKQGKLQLP